MPKEIIILNQVVTCCQDCPRNKAFPNPLWSVLPEVHFCIDCFNMAHKEGRPITFSRNSIPSWCPHADE